MSEEFLRERCLEYEILIDKLNKEKKELIGEFLAEYSLVIDVIMVKLYNMLLVKLDNPTQKIILEKEYFDNVFRDIRDYQLFPRKEKWEERLK